MYGQQRDRVLKTQTEVCSLYNRGSPGTRLRPLDISRSSCKLLLLWKKYPLSSNPLSIVGLPRKNNPRTSKAPSTNRLLNYPTTHDGTPVKGEIGKLWLYVKSRVGHLGAMIEHLSRELWYPFQQVTIEFHRIVFGWSCETGGFSLNSFIFPQASSTSQVKSSSTAVRARAVKTCTWTLRVL